MSVGLHSLRMKKAKHLTRTGLYCKWSQPYSKTQGWQTAK